MSDIPIRLSRKLRSLLLRSTKAKTVLQKLQLFSTLRPSYLVPEVIHFQMLQCNSNLILVISVLAVRNEVLVDNWKHHVLRTHLYWFIKNFPLKMYKVFKEYHPSIISICQSNIPLVIISSAILLPFRHWNCDNASMAYNRDFIIMQKIIRTVSSVMLHI
jgi:hypothetical protein